MDVGEFEEKAKAYFESNPSGLFQEIPAGSGIFNAATVSEDKWKAGFISSNEGRWNLQGESVKYFGSNLSICLAETGHDENTEPSCIFEAWETTRPIRAIDISRLPEDLQIATFEDRGAPDMKWRKPRILLDLAQKQSEYQGIRAIYAPSASGQAMGIQGMCFVANPIDYELKFLTSGNYQTWIDGKFPPSASEALDPA